MVRRSQRRPAWRFRQTVDIGASAIDPGRNAREPPRRSTQPQPPRHDAAQDLARPALDGELRSDEGRVAQHFLEIDPVAGVDVCVRERGRGRGPGAPAPSSCPAPSPPPLPRPAASPLRASRPPRSTCCAGSRARRRGVRALPPSGRPGSRRSRAPARRARRWSPGTAPARCARRRARSRPVSRRHRPRRSGAPRARRRRRTPPSLKSESPVRLRIGRTSMPGESIATRNWVRPWRRLPAAGGEVRSSAIM